MPSLAQEPTNPVTVAVRPLEPFVVDEGDHFSGFSIELWAAIASRAHLDTEFVGVPNVAAQLEAVRTCTADAAITAISITSEREDTVDFSMPMFDAGLGILVADKGAGGLASSLGVLFNSSVVRLLGLLFVGVTLVGISVWFSERRHNEEFRHDRHGGLWEGIWWAFVTLATVGYGDRVPKSATGRILSVIWMLCGLIFVAQFTATITANLTVSRLSSDISNHRDLYGKRVVTVAGTTAAESLTEQKIPATVLADVDAVVDEVESGRADAAVYDIPVLSYQASEREGSLTLFGSAFTTSTTASPSHPEAR